MHEFGVARSLVENVEYTARENRAKEVSEVMVEIGELSFVSVDALRFAYHALVKESELLGSSKLTITEIPARVSCQSCNYEGPLKRFDEPESHFITPLFACPEYNGKIDILQGRECTIKNIRMMVDDDVQVQ
jgi:hydrogenase nickel incorporation protein HypA/HybF